MPRGIGYIDPAILVGENPSITAIKVAKKTVMEAGRIVNEAVKEVKENTAKELTQRKALTQRVESQAKKGKFVDTFA